MINVTMAGLFVSFVVATASCGPLGSVPASSYAVVEMLQVPSFVTPPTFIAATADGVWTYNAGCLLINSFKQKHRINMDKGEPVVAVALLTQTELERLGNTFTRFCPLDQTSAFDDLLKAIDTADDVWRRDNAQ